MNGTVHVSRFRDAVISGSATFDSAAERLVSILSESAARQREPARSERVTRRREARAVAARSVSNYSNLVSCPPRSPLPAASSRNSIDSPCSTNNHENVYALSTPRISLLLT